MGRYDYTTVLSNTVPVRRFRVRVMLSVLFALLFATSTAKATCTPPQPASKTLTLLPVVAHQSQDDRFFEDRDRDDDRNGSILGLWHVTYVLTDGTPFYQSFKFWHPDGTEWESANDGGVCLGVWRETQAGTIRLHHVGWRFDHGTLVGTLTLDEMNTVASNGKTYTGTFVLTQYDVDGNLFRQFKGTLSAKRITVHSTGTP